MKPSSIEKIYSSEQARRKESGSGIEKGTLEGIRAQRSKAMDQILF